MKRMQDLKKLIEALGTLVKFLLVLISSEITTVVSGNSSGPDTEGKEHLPSEKGNPLEVCLSKFMSMSNNA